MFIWYFSIKEEYFVVRNGVGIFDVFYMGEFIFCGKDVLEFFQYVIINDISKLFVISGIYMFVFNERGVVKDEIFVFNMGNDIYMMVCDLDVFEKFDVWFNVIKCGIEKFGDIDFEIENKIYDMVMFLIQGFKVRDFVKEFFGIDINDFWWFQVKEVEFDGIKMFFLRSGYMGENGFEVYFEDVNLYYLDLSKRGEFEKVFYVWKIIFEVGEKYGIKLVGLGVRDIFRFEVGYILYGNEIKEKQFFSMDIDEVILFQVNFDFVIFWDKEFIGKEVFFKQKECGLLSKMVYFKMVDKGVFREGYKVYKDGEFIGEVISGMFLFFFGIGIGIVFVKLEYVVLGVEIEVEIRGKFKKVVIVVLFFYDFKKYGVFREE